MPERDYSHRTLIEKLNIKDEAYPFLPDSSRQLRHAGRDPPRPSRVRSFRRRSRRRSRTTFSGISVARLEAIGAGLLGALARYFGPTELPLEQVPNPEKATS